MIFASCCLAIILIVFLSCILKRSYCPSQYDQMNYQLNQSQIPIDNNSIPDIFTMYPEVANFLRTNPHLAGPLYEKPPTYDETLRFMREEFGIPPPAYRSNQGTPSSQHRFVVSQPELITVSSSEQSNDSPPPSLNLFNVNENETQINRNSVSHLISNDSLEPGPEPEPEPVPGPSGLNVQMLIRSNKNFKCKDNSYDNKAFVDM